MAEWGGKGVKVDEKLRWQVHFNEASISPVELGAKKSVRAAYRLRG